MALHLTPEEHDADPPEGWTVRKNFRSWHLLNKDGNILGTFKTKHEAEAAKTSGFYFELYQKEGRRFRGEAVPGWNPYTPRPAKV